MIISYKQGLSAPFAPGPILSVSHPQLPSSPLGFISSSLLATTKAARPRCCAEMLSQEIVYDEKGVS
jgi:hypothetical protein